MYTRVAIGPDRRTQLRNFKHFHSVSTQLLESPLLKPHYNLDVAGSCLVLEVKCGYALDCMNLRLAVYIPMPMEANICPSQHWNFAPFIARMGV